MKVREKAFYMGLGALLVSIGYFGAQWFPAKAAAEDASSEPRDAVFKDITCRSLTVLDEIGRLRAAILSGDDGGLIAVYGANNVARAVMGSDPNGGTVTVSDVRGKGRAAMHVNEWGGMMLILGRDGSNRVLAASGSSGGDVSIYGNDGRLRGALIATAEGAAVSVHGTDGKKRSIMAVDTAGNGGTQTYDKAGRRTGGLPSAMSDLDIH